LEIRDVHSQIRVVTRKIESIEGFLSSKIPLDILNEFYESNINKFNRHRMDAKRKMIKKFNTINGVQNKALNNFFNMDKSKWIINESNVKIPERIINILSLGDKFALPLDVNDYHDCRDMTLNLIKNFEISCYKFPENSLDKLRAIMVNLINKQLYSSKHLNYFDSRMLKEFNRCKKFLRDNEELFVTRADK